MIDLLRTRLQQVAPANAVQEEYLDFPVDFEICAQDLPSNYALKLHALLCRPYLKGRDWFDFAWYCKQKTRPNLPHLAHALAQNGPWAGQNTPIDIDWLANS